MAGLQLQRFGDVARRSIIILQHVIDRGPLVPGFGEFRLHFDQTREGDQRLMQLAIIHLADSGEHVALCALVRMGHP